MIISAADVRNSMGTYVISMTKLYSIYKEHYAALKLKNIYCLKEYMFEFMTFNVIQARKPIRLINQVDCKKPVNNPVPGRNY